MIAVGADGITAMDSIGPVLRIDIKTARPMLGSVNGFGWLTGSAIKPVILRYVAEIAMEAKVPIIGTGGVMTAEDGIEMLMAGAAAVGVCTAPILKGSEYIAVLNEKTAGLLRDLGYDEPKTVSGAALKRFPDAELYGELDFSFDPITCTACGRCVTVCPYDARNLTGDKASKNKEMSLDTNLCRYCGLCVSVCPTHALTAAW